MDFLKSLVEFLGTYLAFMVIYYFATRHPKYIAPAVGFAFGSVVFLFSKISADFNPVATLIFVLEKKQPVSDLITLVIPQLLAGLAVVETFKHIK
jgi:glycerol uptake facilitator-like aquaporin